MKEMELHLVGSTYCEGQKFLRRIMASGQALQLEKLVMVRDPQNPYDVNAVQVWYDDNGNNVRLGFVNRDQAPDVAECLDNDGGVTVIDAKIYGSSDTNYGLFFRVRLIYLSDYELPDYDIPEDHWYDDSCDSFNTSVDTPSHTRGLAKVGVPF